MAPDNGSYKRDEPFIFYRLPPWNCITCLVNFPGLPESKEKNNDQYIYTITDNAGELLRIK
ncbi:hypothetical protein [Desulfomarina sp.]